MSRRLVTRSKDPSADGRQSRRSAIDRGGKATDPTGLLELQRQAGNQAVTDLIVAQREVAVISWIKDAAGHVKKGKKEEEGGEEWEKDSEHFALHAKQVFWVGEKVFKIWGGRMEAMGDEEGVKGAEEWAEHFSQGAELFETGEKAFNKGVKLTKLVTLIMEIEEANAKIDVKNRSDASLDRAAEGFDEMFTAFGKLGKLVAPDGPWQGYFDFLTHFKDGGGFFLNMRRLMATDARKADDAFFGREPKPLEPAPSEQKEETKPETEAPAATISLDDLWQSILSKIGAAAPRLGYATEGVAKEKENIREKLSKVNEDRKQLGAKRFWESKAELRNQLNQDLHSLRAAVDHLETLFATAGIVDIDFKAELAAVDRAHAD
jgi:hypothetical protein